MSDPIDQAIAAAPPAAIAAKRYEFAVSDNAGNQRPVAVIFPADLTWELLVALLDGVNHIGQQVIKDAHTTPAAGLTLVRGTLPKN